MSNIKSKSTPVYLALSSLGIFLLSALISTDGAAQAEAIGGKAEILEEVIVTARRREESLQETPESVSVLSSDMIETKKIARLDDMVDSVSNMFMINDQDPSTNIITIRGITTNRNQPSSVAFLIDGVTQPDTDGISREYFDLERVEVLKGPQGALYGKNAIGGVVHVITKKPGNEFAGSVKAEVGDGGLLKAQGAVTGPMIEDELFFRLSGSYVEKDGHITNRTLDTEPDFLESRDLSGRLLWEPNEELSIDFRASYVDEDGGATWFSVTDLMGPTNNDKVSEGLLEDPVADLLGAYERTLRDYSIKLDYEIAGGTITSISSYNEISKFFEGDLDNSPDAIIQPASQELDLDAWTQEIRFTSADEQRLRYIGGAFFQKTNRDFEQIISGFDIGFFGLVPGLPPGVPSGILIPLPPIATESEFEQWAGFGQINYDVTERVELTVALRFDKETREQTVVGSGTTDKTSFEDWQPKVTVSYDFNSDFMIYGTYAEGFKSGGFNPPPENFPDAIVDFNLVIDKEETEGIEIGFKSAWKGNRVIFNAAAFYTNYDGLQLFQFDASAQQVTINANEVDIYGVETELVFVPIEGLTIDFSYGYTDSEIVDFNGTGVNDDNKTPNTPEYTANFGVQYELPLASGVKMLARADYRSVGDFYWQETNDLFTPGYDFINLRLSFNYRNWTLGFWGENVTDERWAVGGFSRNFSPATSRGKDVYTINQGRQVGVDLRLNF